MKKLNLVSDCGLKKRIGRYFSLFVICLNSKYNKEHEFNPNTILYVNKFKEGNNRPFIQYH